MTFFFLKNLSFQKSLKQRLGKSNIQARLGRPAGPLARGAMGGRGLAMGQRGLPRGALRGGRGARALLRGGVSLRGRCCSQFDVREPGSVAESQNAISGFNSCFLKVRACCVEAEVCPPGWA